MGVLLPQGLAACKAYYRLVEGKTLFLVSGRWDLKAAVKPLQPLLEPALAKQR